MIATSRKPVLSMSRAAGAHPSTAAAESPTRPRPPRRCARSAACSCRRRSPRRTAPPHARSARRSGTSRSGSADRRARIGRCETAVPRASAKRPCRPRAGRHRCRAAADLNRPLGDLHRAFRPVVSDDQQCRHVSALPRCSRPAVSTSSTRRLTALAMTSVAARPITSGRTGHTSSGCRLALVDRRQHGSARQDDRGDRRLRTRSPQALRAESARTDGDRPRRPATALSGRAPSTHRRPPAARREGAWA